jgi:hypothetical protein
VRGFRLRNAITMVFNTYSLICYMFRSHDHLQVEIYIGTVASQSRFTADSQSVCLGVGSLCGRFTKYCFLFKSSGLEFVVLSLWVALSGERPGLSFVKCKFPTYIFPLEDGRTTETSSR